MFAIHLHLRQEKGCRNKVVTFDSEQGAFDFLDTLLTFADAHLQFQVFHIIDGSMLHITEQFLKRRLV